MSGGERGSPQYWSPSHVEQTPSEAPEGRGEQLLYSDRERTGGLSSIQTCSQHCARFIPADDPCVDLDAVT